MEKIKWIAVIMFFVLGCTFPPAAISSGPDVDVQALRDAGAKGKIVFTRKPADGGENTREIYVMDTGTGKLTRLTDNNYVDNYARLSHDGTKIVFESIRKDLNGNGKLDEEDLDIYIMDADGRNQRRLLQENHFKGHPQWFPDGQKIVFVSKRSLKPNVYVVNVDGSGLKPLTKTGDAIDPALSPDGKRVVYVRFKAKPNVPITSLAGDLWIMNADGTRDKKIFDSEQGVKSRKFKHSIFDPAWSPDGKWIAFMRRMGDKGNFGFGVWHIFIIRPDGTDLRDLNSDNTGFYGYPHWSPDSRYLSIWGFDIKNGTVPHLMLINVSTREIRDLTNNRTVNDEMPYWR